VKVDLCQKMMTIDGLRPLSTDDGQEATVGRMAIVALLGNEPGIGADEKLKRFELAKRIARGSWISLRTVITPEPGEGEPVYNSTEERESGFELSPEEVVLIRKAAHWLPPIFLGRLYEALQ